MPELQETKLNNLENHLMYCVFDVVLGLGRDECGTEKNNRLWETLQKHSPATNMFSQPTQ